MYDRMGYYVISTNTHARPQIGVEPTKRVHENATVLLLVLFA